MSADRIRYRFGLFEADPQDGRLLRQGTPVRLQEQPFQVLIALLERHGDLVTRDEIRGRLWPGDTFVEFDKSLGVALTKVRAALGDDAANPRFIETLPKRGYRFIAPVTVDTAGSPAGTAPSIVPPVPVNALSTRHIVGLGGVAALTLVVLALITWRAGWRRPASTASRVSIVISEFTNNTGDPIFVGSLRGAATVALRQSPFLSVMADPAIADTLQTLGRAPIEVLTAPLARDVCAHAHGDVLVDGDISLAADTYTLVVEATRCADGGMVARETQTFTKKDDALPALGHEIEQLRTALGESRESLQAYDVPLQVATTNSLEALRAFHLGMDLRLRADNLRAIPALKAAITLDPQFALAYVQIGSAYSNIGDEIEGRPYFSKAFELRDRVTEPERLLITGRYFDIITREMEKAIETYRLWTGLYPDDWQPLNGLANDANQIGRYEVAAQAAKRAIALGPRQTFPRVNLMTAFAALNRFSEATSAAHDVLARTPENISAHIALYAIARHLGDVATADRELAWAAQRPPSSGMLYVEAEDAGQHGRFEQMTRLFRESARLDRDAGNGEGGGNTLAFSAVLNSLAGRSDAALADAATAATLGHNEIILGSVGVVDARAGRAEAARQSLEALNRTYPLSTYALGMYGPMVRSAQLAQTPAAAAAITAATSAELPYEFGQYGSMIAPYLRGLAYMAAHAPDLAVVEFQKLIDHVGVDPGSPLYAMGYLGVARADAAVGKHEESQKAYKALHELWADAERDTPIVRAALAESVEAHRF